MYEQHFLKSITFDSECLDTVVVDTSGLTVGDATLEKNHVVINHLASKLTVWISTSNVSKKATDAQVGLDSD